MGGTNWGGGISVCYAPLDISCYSPTTACNEISSHDGGMLINDMSSNTNKIYGIQFKMCPNRNSRNSVFQRGNFFNKTKSTLEETQWSSISVALTFIKMLTKFGPCYICLLTF